MKTETEPKQTPLERLIEKMKIRCEINSKAGDELSFSRMVAYSNVIEIAESLLPEERKVIETAYKNGKTDQSLISNGIEPSRSNEVEYFTTKFKQ